MTPTDVPARGRSIMDTVAQQNLQYFRAESRAIIAAFMRRGFRSPDEGEPLSVYVVRCVRLLEKRREEPTP
jgi:hypothetical protein